MDNCNSAVVPRLQYIVNRLDSGLQTQGMSNNKFGLVGYGGDRIFDRPHSHTMDGMLMASADRFQQAVDNWPEIESTHGDPMAAVEFAARYNFRMGVSKTIILVPCEICNERSTSYSQVQTLLNDRGIALSILMQHEFSTKDDPVSSYIFGIDRQTVYSRKDFGDVNPVGDMSLRSEVAVPKDYCTALADHTNGTLFNSQHLVGGGTQAQKKFLDVMSAVVAMKGQPATCQNCQCVPNAGLGGTDITYCEPCDQNSIFYSIFPDLIENFDSFEAGDSYAA